MTSDRATPYNYLSGRPTFNRILADTWNLFLDYSHRVHTEQWQGVSTQGRNDLETYELMNYNFTHRLKGVEDLAYWKGDIEPNLPWADDHFKERVCGAPLNPGIQWRNWPWGNSASNFLGEAGMFNHNYMERYWPKEAGLMEAPTYTSDEFEDLIRSDWVTASRKGIRNEYGDMNDLVESLASKPLSRQEWYPIFFPEDVGEVVGGRKPCSLGYQFWVRDKELHVYYPLRSCDFFRHMRDDIYLTVRLMLWVLNKCRSLHQKHPEKYPNWLEVSPGTFTMHCTSLHVFVNDMLDMKRKGHKK